MKFDVSGAWQAVLFEAARAAELSASSSANDKFRYRLVSLDLPARLDRRVVSFVSRQKKGIKNRSKNLVSKVRKYTNLIKWI